MESIRLGIIALEPLRGLLICIQRFLHISQLNLIYLGQVLLLSRRAAQVSAQNIVLDRTGENTGRILRVGLAVDLECFLEGIGRIVGLVEVLRLNVCCFLKGLASFLIYSRVNTVH